jgi:hypothetical protein
MQTSRVEEYGAFLAIVVALHDFSFPEIGAHVISKKTKQKALILSLEDEGINVNCCRSWYHHHLSHYA